MSGASPIRKHPLASISERYKPRFRDNLPTRSKAWAVRYVAMCWWSAAGRSLKEATAAAATGAEVRQGRAAGCVGEEDMCSLLFLCLLCVAGSGGGEEADKDAKSSHDHRGRYHTTKPVASPRPLAMTPPRLDLFVAHHHQTTNTITISSPTPPMNPRHILQTQPSACLLAALWDGVAALWDGVAATVDRPFF